MKFFQPTSTMQSSGLAINSSNESLSNLLEEEVNDLILGNDLGTPFLSSTIKKQLASKFKLLALMTTLALLVLQNPLKAQFMTYGNGSDGDVFIPYGSTKNADSIRAEITTSSIGPSYTRCTLSNTFSYGIFTPGMKVIIHSPRGRVYNMSDSAYATRNYHFANVLNYIAGTRELIVDDTLNITGTNVQVICVPQYNNLIIKGKITCHAYDGHTGGILCFNVKDSLHVYNGGYISTVGKGCNGGFGGIGGLAPTSSPINIGGAGGMSYGDSGRVGHGSRPINYKLLSNIGVGFPNPSCYLPGGIGGVGYFGNYGTAGTNGTTGINLTESDFNQRIINPANGGAGGKGGYSAGNGGSGGGGGASYYPGNNGTNGTNVATGTKGGNGGNGGVGAGAIYVFAKGFIGFPGRSPANILAQSKKADDGYNAIGNGGDGGNGGKGANAGCGVIPGSILYFGIGAGGTKGMGGDGGDGGDGGSGGNGGSVWLIYKDTFPYNIIPSSHNIDITSNGQGAGGGGTSAGNNGLDGPWGDTLTTPCPSCSVNYGYFNQTVWHDCACDSAFNILNRKITFHPANMSWTNIPYDPALPDSSFLNWATGTYKYDKLISITYHIGTPSTALAPGLKVRDVYVCYIKKGAHLIRDTLLSNNNFVPNALYHTTPVPDGVSFLKSTTAQEFLFYKYTHLIYSNGPDTIYHKWPHDTSSYAIAECPLLPTGHSIGGNVPHEGRPGKQGSRPGQLGTTVIKNEQNNFPSKGAYKISQIENYISVNSNSIKLFPNPNNGQFELEYYLVKGCYHVNIYDMTGRTILNEVLNITETKGSYKIYLPKGLSVGLYNILILGTNYQNKLQFNLIK